MSQDLSLFVQINDPEELCVTLRVESAYNPDILTDMTNRAIWLYKTSFDHRFEKIGVEEESEDDD